MAVRKSEPLHGNALGKKDDMLAICLAKGMTRGEAALHAGVSLRTVYNKLATPAFRDLVRSHQKQFIDAAYGELADGIGPLVKKLKRLIESPDPKVVVAAAKTLGALFIKVGIFHAQEERFAVLEEKVREKERE